MTTRIAEAFHLKALQDDINSVADGDFSRLIELDSESLAIAWYQAKDNLRLANLEASEAYNLLLEGPHMVSQYITDLEQVHERSKIFATLDQYYMKYCRHYTLEQVESGFAAHCDWFPV